MFFFSKTIRIIRQILCRHDFPSVERSTLTDNIKTIHSEKVCCRKCGHQEWIVGDLLCG